MRSECPRAAEVAAAIAAGCGTDLHRHVAGCPTCADLVLVMSSLRAERDRSRRSAPVPPAGLVWWRAQLRQRQAAARAAAAPVAVLHAATLVLVLGLSAFFAWTVARGAAMPQLAEYLPTLPSWTAAATAGGDTSSLLRFAAPLVATAWLILGPVALYFALRKD